MFRETSFSVFCGEFFTTLDFYTGTKDKEKKVLNNVSQTSLAVFYDELCINTWHASLIYASKDGDCQSGVFIGVQLSLAWKLFEWQTH